MGSFWSCREQTINRMVYACNDNECVCAFFNRHGGVGAAPYATNNVSFGVGDDAVVVGKNRTAIRHCLQVEQLVSARQVHGDMVYRYEGGTEASKEVVGVDALITDRMGVGLMIQQADCQAILLYDPVRPAIGAIHCGWRGNVAGIIEKTVAMMGACYATDPGRLLAAVSPSLGPCCGEFIHYKKELPPDFRRFQVRDSYFDFWQISRWQLQECGIREEAIRIAGICTVCSADYFSYRRSGHEGAGITGRNCSVIALRRKTI